MKAILLAAGVGSRIANSIGETPKSLLKVDGKPLIIHTIELLQRNHIEVVVVTGFKHNMIEETIKNYHIKTYYNPFYAVTNSIGSLWYARDEFNTGEIIIANADVYYTQELLDLIFNSNNNRFLLNDKTRVLVGDYFFKTKDDIIVDYGKELKIDERDSEYVGVACIRDEWVKLFKDRMCNMIEQGKYNLWWENVLYSFIPDTDIYAQDVNGVFWSEIDTIEDYNRVLTYVETH